MNLSDIFRSFIGLPPRARNHNDRSSPFYEEDYPHHARQNPEDPLGPVFFNFNEMMSEMDDIFSHFDEAMKGMGSFDVFPKFGGAFTYELPSNGAESESLRGHMLKEPDRDNPAKDGGSCDDCIEKSKPQLRKWEKFSRFTPNLHTEQKDSDIDGEVNLDQIFGPANPERNFDQVFGPANPDRNFDIVPSNPKPKSFFKSVVVKSVRTPDGKIEQQRTIRDGTGKEETTVTRTIDDQTHSVTTTKNSDGSEETIENFNNLDESNKHEFEKRWHVPSLFNQGFGRTQIPEVLFPQEETRLDPKKNTIFHNIFGHDFPGWKS